MSEGETVIRYELGRIGCTVERIDEILLDVKRTAARDGVPRIEQCVDCRVFVSDWVEADEAPTGRICRPCETVRSLRRQLEDSERLRKAGWRGLANLYHFVTENECDEETALGQATSAVSQLKHGFEAHRKHVGEFLGELHAIMIDPLAKGEISVKDLCAALLEQARKDRESLQCLASLEAARSSSMSLADPAANWHPFIPPFSYDDQAQFIQDAENHLLLDIRGWGFLTGQGSGGLGLNDVAALAIQDEIGRRITALLNGSDLSLLIGLLQLTDREDSKGNWRVIIEYDNYQDGARILDGDGNILGECYDLDKKPNEKFLAAVIEAVAPNLAFARHLQACQQCGGPDDGCEEGQRLEQAMLSARAALDAKRKTNSPSE